MFQTTEKISSFQSVLLIASAGGMNSYTLLITTAIKTTKNDAWLFIILSYMVTLIIGLITIDLSRQFPDKTIVQYLPKVFGKYLGKAFSLAYILILWFIIPLVFRTTIEYTLSVLPLTPPTVLYIFMGILVFYTMKKGFEVFARTLQIGYILIVAILLITIIFALPSCDFSNLTPILENGFLSPLKSSVVIFPYTFQAIIIMAFWLPCMNNPEKGNKSLIIGISVVCTVTVLLTCTILAFMGPKLAAMYNFPLHEIAKYIEFGNFLSGFELITIFIWICYSYIALVLFSYPTIVGLAQWLNLKDYSVLIFPVILISIILAKLPSNVINADKLSIFKNIYLLYPLTALIFVTWITAKIRKSTL